MHSKLLYSLIFQFKALELNIEWSVQEISFKTVWVTTTNITGNSWIWGIMVTSTYHTNSLWGLFIFCLLNNVTPERHIVFFVFFINLINIFIETKRSCAPCHSSNVILCLMDWTWRLGIYIWKRWTILCNRDFLCKVVFDILYDSLSEQWMFIQRPASDLTGRPRALGMAVDSTLTIPYTFKHHPRLALTPIKTQVYGSVTSSWKTRSSVLPPCATGRAQAGSSTCHVYIAMTMCTFCHRWLRKGWCIHWEKTRGVCWIIPLGMRMRDVR